MLFGILSEFIVSFSFTYQVCVCVCVCACRWLPPLDILMTSMCTCRMCIQTHCVTNWITIFISLFGYSLSVPSLLDWACTNVKWGGGRGGGKGEEGGGGRRLAEFHKLW